MKKIKWEKNYYHENGVKKLEWFAMTETRAAKINRTWDNTILLKREYQVKNYGISFWYEATLLSFDTVKGAKMEAEKWLLEA